MSAAPDLLDHTAASPTGDLLIAAIAHVRPHLMRGSVSDRVRSLWAGVTAARDLAAADMVEREFTALAHEVGLHLGLHADVDLRHVIRWAMLGMNPFGNK
jgi:hypothetical protein